MGHVDERDPEVALQSAKLPAHAHPQEGVEGGERFVEQKHRRVGDECARERDTLLLPAGELRGHALHVVAHVDQIELPERDLVALGLRHTPHPQAERDVVPAVQVREQCVVLEHHGGRAVGRRQPSDVVSVDGDPPGADLLVAGDHPQGRRLAASGRAEQAAVAAGGHREVDVIDRGHRAVGLHDSGQLDAAFHGRCRGSGSRRSRPGGSVRARGIGPGPGNRRVSHVRHRRSCCHDAAEAAWGRSRRGPRASPDSRPALPARTPLRRRPRQEVYPASERIASDKLDTAVAAGRGS